MQEQSTLKAEVKRLVLKKWPPGADPEHDEPEEVLEREYESTGGRILVRERVTTANSVTETTFWQED